MIAFYLPCPRTCLFLLALSTPATLAAPVADSDKLLVNSTIVPGAYITYKPVGFPLLPLCLLPFNTVPRVTNSCLFRRRFAKQPAASNHIPDMSICLQTHSWGRTSRCTPTSGFSSLESTPKQPLFPSGSKADLEYHQLPVHSARMAHVPSTAILLRRS